MHQKITPHYFYQLRSIK